MAPAIECGVCGYKAVTDDEPATEEQIVGLMDAYAEHIERNLINAMNAISEKEKEGSHPINMIYHPETPIEGFDKAKIISGVTTRRYHRKEA